MHALLQHRAGGEHRALAEAAALQHGGAHADERALLDDAALELGRVADGRVLLDQGGQVFGAVDDHVVLDVGALADTDRRLVRSQDRAEPHAGAFFDFHVADEDRGGCDVGVRVHLRAPSAELKLHWPL